MIGGIVSDAWDGINPGPSWCVTGLLGTGFDRNAYGIKFGLDEGIEIVISDISFEVCSDLKLGVLMIEVWDSFNGGVRLFVPDWLGAGFDGNLDGIVLYIRIRLVFPIYIFFFRVLVM